MRIKFQLFKTHILLVLLSLFANQSYASELSDGFRGMKWGDKPLSEMSKVDLKANMVIYMKRNEDRVVLGQNATTIDYWYHRNGLCRVQINWIAHKNNDMDMVFVKLGKAWGKPILMENFDRIRSAKWESVSGNTSAFVGSLASVSYPGEWITTISIQEKSCSKDAIEGNGL